MSTRKPITFQTVLLVGAAWDTGLCCDIAHGTLTLQWLLLTYLLTPWCRVILEKLTVLQLVKKFPAFHGTRRFITALTSVRQLSLSWASPIQTIYPHPISWRFILILSTHLHLGLPIGLLPSGFPTKTLYTPSLLTHTRHIPSPSHSSRNCCYLPNQLTNQLQTLLAPTNAQFVRRIKKMHTFFINNSIQLYCLRNVSNN